jgi:hypothetical protein
VGLSSGAAQAKLARSEAVRFVLPALAALLVSPASALATGPTLTMREVPLHGVRTIAAAVPTFNMVGLHWRGTGRIEYRTRSASGGWSAWRRGDDDDRVERGWHLGNLDWTGTANAIGFRTTGAVARLRVYYVWSPPEPLGGRRLQVAGSPSIIPRASWGANEAIRRAPPAYTDTIQFAVVHHTAGSNDYTPQQSAAIVRGIEIYHVQGNGWNDIGYNLLVDKYGQVFEGRYGGVDRAVIGAHALGFNAGSVGVAVLGDYGTAQVPAASKSALERVLAWRLDLAHIDPRSTLTWISGGNPRFPAGIPVFLRVIAGHRDTNFTDCPGDNLYALLPQIAQDVAQLGGPKIYDPAVAANGEGQVRFTARLSTSQPWSVTVTGSSGTAVAQGTGSGTSVDWTWDSTAAPPDSYSWSIASPGARSASGSLAPTAALAVQSVALQPAQVAPGEPATLSYKLSAPAQITASIAGADGQTIVTLPAVQKPAGTQTLSLTLPVGLALGLYTVQVSAAAGPQVALATAQLTLDDILTGFTLTPAKASASLAFSLARLPASLTFQVLRASQVVAAPAAPAPVVGPQTFVWDGTLADGTRAPDGAYTLAVTVSDDVGTFTRSAPLTVDTTPPRITVLSYRNLRFRVSEAATLTLTVGARRFVRSVSKPATTEFWLKTKPKRYSLVATDAAGNSSTVRYRR